MVTEHVGRSAVKVILKYRGIVRIVCTDKGILKKYGTYNFV